MHARQGIKLIIIAASTALICMLSLGAFAQAGVKADVPKLNAQNSRMLVEEVEPELQRFVDRQRRLPNQAKQVLVKLTPEIGTGIIWIDLDAGYLPKNSTVFLEDFGELVRQVENEGYELISGVVGFRYIQVRIGGKDLDEIYPPERLKRKKAASEKANANAIAAPVQGLVVLNPGHGKYLNHSDETWRYQRPTAYVGTTNVYEDTVTPSYSSQLASLLTARSSDTVTSVKHTRDIANTTIDPESGLAWSVLGARYHLKRLYPTLGATIWNRFPNGSPDRPQPDRSNLREYDDDIRSRPEYANYINAETMISLHTDAADASARGATVVTNLGDPGSYQLATNIHCYLTEQITQVPAYASYPIRAGIRPATAYGEVREANMSTALVEIGFHTNTVDSAALRNSTFRAAAMKGVEKGYRMDAEGRTACEPFRISGIPDVSGPKGSSIPVQNHYVGYPRFPVKRKSVVVSCPGGGCTGGEMTFNSGPSPLLSTAQCGSRAITIRMRVILADADGVQTPPAEYNFTCV